jgi:two-component system, NtrC family, response regulator HydG
MSQQPELTERDTRGRQGAVSFRIVVTSGAGAGKDVWVRATTPGPIRIGSSSVCDMVISDRKVSRHHLSIEYQDGRIRLSDLESTNGTNVNGVAVDTVFLEGGEVIRLGDTVLSVEVHAEAAKVSLPPQRSFGRIIGASTAMRRLYPVFERLAASDVPVLIEGETGTGKELLAETLHEMGPRKHLPFVTVELPAPNADLIEAALFGIEKATSGGVVVEKGVFEETQGGTVLIDDVAELPAAPQQRLVRVLERGEIVRVNGKESVSVAVRVLAATRGDLDREVENGNFREDLFYRLAVGRVELPPLRRREGDVAFLAGHFWRGMERSGTSLPPDLIFALGHRWPGNVRELKNLITRRLVMGKGGPPLPKENDSRGTLQLESLVADDPSFSEARARVIAEFERFFVKWTLERHGGNVTKAAASSGLARRYFHQLKSRYRE